jgi:hypoxanthine phosphoribosyltransferase
LSKYKGKKILVVDDINDSGTTLIGINAVIEKFDHEHNNNRLVMHEELRYSTLFSKESSNFADVDYTANEVLPDQERWIVFPYEEWWT